MKQIKIKEPIIYSSIWILCLVIIIILDKIWTKSLDWTGYLWLIFAIFIGFVSLYLTIGWVIALKVWFDWYKTRDMNKYISNNIKEKQEEIKSLQEEIENLQSIKK